MADYSLKQGEDKKVILEVIKKGTQVDLSTPTKVMGKLCIDDKEVKRYSLISESDHGTLEKDVDDNWKINLFITRAESKNFPKGIMTVALLIEFPDTDFPEQIRVEEFNFKIGRVLQGKGFDLDI